MIHKAVDKTPFCNQVIVKIASDKMAFSFRIAQVFFKHN